MKRKETFIERCALIHSNKYDYSLVEYKNSKIKVKILCYNHGVFEQSPNCHLSGKGCKKCANNIHSLRLKLNINDILFRFNEKYNNKYDYSLVEYKNARTKIKIICREHGIFKQIPKDHLHTEGCKKCKIDSDAKLFIEKCKLIHSNKYDYSSVVYKNVLNKVKIICHKHGVFEQNVRKHLEGHGCTNCFLDNRRLNTLNFINKAIVIHGDKYDYSLVNYIKSSLKVIIKCKTHGDFYMKPNSHLNNQGCPQCNNNCGAMENKWLDNNNVSKEFRQYKIKNFRVDGIDLNNNTIYEFYGDFWHGNPEIYNKNDINRVNYMTFGELYNKTIERENYLKSLGYNVVSIWEKEYKNIQKL